MRLLILATAAILASCQTRSPHTHRLSHYYRDTQEQGTQVYTPRQASERPGDPLLAEEPLLPISGEQIPQQTSQWASNSLEAPTEVGAANPSEQATAQDYAPQPPPGGVPLSAESPSYALGSRPAAASAPATAGPQDSTYPPASRSTAPSTHTNRYYDPSYRPAVGDHYVRGYTRRDGTYVAPHKATDPDDSFWNNYSSEGNVNPYNGRVGTKTPSSSSYSGGSTYVRGYYRKDGTYVRGHTRRSR